MSENTENKKNYSTFQSIDTLVKRKKDGSFHEIIEDWQWIFSYSKKYKGAIAFYTIVGVLSTTFGLVSSVVSKYVIDIVTGYQSDKLMLLICVMVGTSLFSLVFTNLLSRISTKLSLAINCDIQADIYDQIMDADWLSISHYSNGDLLNRFNNDVNIIATNSISWLPSIVIALYNFFATFFVIWYYNKIMALIAFISAPFLLLASRYFIRKQREYRKKVRDMSSNMMTFEVESFYNYDTIKSFGITKIYGQKLREWQKKFIDLSLKYNLFTIKTDVFVSILALIVQMIAFMYCLWLLWNHSITYGTMMLFLTQRQNLSNAFNKVIGIVPSFLNSSVSAQRVRELVELPREVHTGAPVESKDYVNCGCSIELCDVNYSYVEGTPVISNSKFAAHPGEIIGIIGPSGEGKTTLIRLVLGLIRPHSGKVFIKSGNGEVMEANMNTRRLFAYVPQGNTIISGTIADNLQMVKQDATEEEMIDALKTACAWEFVEKLPDKLNTVIRERGKGLSEGQAQRIAIARSFLCNAPILLLDEATSALDVETERKVLHNIVHNNPNKTVIITTHRPTVIDLCKRVYRVMDTQITQLDDFQSAKMAIDF